MCIRDRDRLIESVRNALFGFEWINIKTVLKAHAEEAVFYKTDHHWTTYGAFFAYEEWAKSRGKTASGEPVSYTHLGDESVGYMKFSVIKHEEAILKNMETTIFLLIFSMD